MKKLVIAGSASLQEKIKYWKNFFEEKDYLVTDYPVAISKENFNQEYPKVHQDFFKNITEADVLFIMNEDKNGIKGYIGAETFAELAFGVAQNLVYNKNLEVILLQKPSKGVQSYEEVELWLELGWIKLYR